MSRIRPFVPALIWMGCIFALSTSLFGAEETGSLVRYLVRYIYPPASQDTVDAVSIAVRKSAHFTEYAVLASLWYRGLTGGSGLDARSAVVAAFAVSAVYAATDEFHQAFVPGRTPSVMDVLLDSAGAASACFLLWSRHKKARPSGRAV